ncbi:hypothetical protein RDWZM_006987 [Blomia tropicalis]|uniref:R3H domain-containing protein n=1 Tax=Blomia tropicalis TaxID=40697 RepID=A0A9Q0M8L3_BLOTA|nr:hypothetical protein RDWZM_006987 [Blomia tropicalis]
MDLLGSILDTMEKPPNTPSKQGALLKKQKEDLKKFHEMEKDKLKKFRLNIEKKLLSFQQDELAQKVEFEPMEKLFRTIIHDIADKHNLIAFSFGIDQIDRHSVVYKKEFKPSEEELDALRKGQVDVYDRKLKELQEKMQEKCDKVEDNNKSKASGSKDINPNWNYTYKYANMIGLDVGQAAAKVTTPNQQFGMVPSSNKRDLRSIEQILNDNKLKKMRNLKPTD